MSKSFEALQKHAINLELDLQQCKEKIKNDKSFKENQSNVFLKEREQYFKIQDLKAQLQDKGIAISKPATFSDSLAKKDFSKSKLLPHKCVQDFSKPFHAHDFAQNVCNFKNTKLIAPGMYRVHTSRQQMAVPISTREPMLMWTKSDATSSNEIPLQQTSTYQEILVEIILFIIDFGCSKHMIGNLKLLTNFVEKFLGTVKFGNDQIAPILGYGDLVQGTITIKRVYYV
ncbi:hypothetical protein Tco_0363364 [Tanacetum coccineum]